MATKKRLSNCPPAISNTSNKLSALQALQDFPDVWSGWQNRDIGTEQSLENKGDFTSRMSPHTAKRFRKALKNPSFVELLLRVKADMQVAADAPLRAIVIHYRASDPLYPSDDVMLHFSAHEHLQKFLVLCSRQGRIRPEHPDYPFGADGFTKEVARNPMVKV